MKAVECPYCGEVNHSCTPEVLAECAYCDHRFAEIRDENQTIVVLDGGEPDTWMFAEQLVARWQDEGELEKEVVVNRRLSEEEYDGEDRRRFPDPLPRRRVMISTG